MKLYLIQHGDAVPDRVNSQRPLSPRGRADVDALAAHMARIGARAGRVINSGKLRARQTAEIVAAAIAPTVGVEDVAEGLRPNDSTDWLAAALARWTGDTVCVGHLPFVGRMVSRLVTASDDVPIVSFIPGAAVCLARGEDVESWTIAWMITPDLLRP